MLIRAVPTPLLARFDEIAAGSPRECRGRAARRITVSPIAPFWVRLLFCDMLQRGIVTRAQKRLVPWRSYGVAGMAQISIGVASPAADVLSQSLRAIRKKRGMTVAVIAAAMNMRPRTYEDFEGARGPMTFDRIFAFAAATDSDPFALLLGPSLSMPELAVNCADTKLVTILVMHLQEFVEREGADITYLEPAHIIGAAGQMFKQLTATLKESERFIKNFLEQKTGWIGLAALKLRGLWFPR